MCVVIEHFWSLILLSGLYEIYKFLSPETLIFRIFLFTCCEDNFYQNYLKLIKAKTDVVPIWYKRRKNLVCWSRIFLFAEKNVYLSNTPMIWSVWEVLVLWNVYCELTLCQLSWLLYTLLISNIFNQKLGCSYFFFFLWLC